MPDFEDRSIPERRIHDLEEPDGKLDRPGGGGIRPIDDTPPPDRILDVPDPDRDLPDGDRPIDDVDRPKDDELALPETSERTIHGPLKGSGQLSIRGVINGLGGLSGEHTLHKARRLPRHQIKKSGKGNNKPATTHYYLSQSGEVRLSQFYNQKVVEES